MLNNVVLVKFRESVKEYAYLTGEKLEVGDQVVVDTPSGLQVVVVTQTNGLTESQHKKACKWVVQKVDMQAYEDRLAKQVLAQEIRNKLRQKKEQVEELMIYKTLAANDPEVKDLLSKLGELEGITGLGLLTEEKQD